MRRYVMALLLLSAGLWAKPLSWNRDVEIIFGFYDIGVTTSLRVLDTDFLFWKPLVLRWNPFVYVMNFETGIQYFPLRQFQKEVWIFGSKGVEPFVFAEVKLPHTFQAMSVPVGLGLGHFWEHVGVAARVYADVTVVPVVSTGWSWELALQMKW